MPVLRGLDRRPPRNAGRVYRGAARRNHPDARHPRPSSAPRGPDPTPTASEDSEPDPRRLAVRLTPRRNPRLSNRMPQTDAAAVALARDGDSEAFRALVERHSRAVYRLAHRMTGNPSDAEDVVQETFLEGLQATGPIRVARQLRDLAAPHRGELLDRPDSVAAAPRIRRTTRRTSNSSSPARRREMPAGRRPSG